MVKTAYCAKCGNEKQESHKHPRTANGVQLRCRPCRLAQARKYQRTWKKQNPGLNTAYENKRRTSKMHRTPKWLGDEQLNAIAQFYIDAEYLTNYTKTQFEVDHVVPLQGKLVSGLHVPWNLQILTATENQCKGNKI